MKRVRNVFTGKFIKIKGKSMVDIMIDSGLEHKLNMESLRLRHKLEQEWKTQILIGDLKGER